MPDLYSSFSGTTDDGNCNSGVQTSWANARDADGSGGVVNVNISAASAFCNVLKQATRGGGSNYNIKRSFLCFDTSGITGTVNSATIKIYGFSQNAASIIAEKSTAFGGDGSSALATTDFNNISGFTTGSSLAGNATTYGPQILTTSWSTSGYNNFTGTSDLRADMQNNDVVIICFMDYTNDYLNSALTSNVQLDVGGWYAESADASKRPYIEYALAGYGNNAIGVDGAKIGKVIGVASADIGKIIGV